MLLIEVIERGYHKISLLVVINLLNSFMWYYDNGTLVRKKSGRGYERQARQAAILPFYQDTSPESPPVKNEIVIAFISFLLLVT